jgi:chorismate mutase
MRRAGAGPKNRLRRVPDRAEHLKMNVMNAAPNGAPDPSGADAKLDELRAEIDRIDGEILGLLRARAEVVADVARAKLEGSDQGTGEKAFFRPGREARMLRRLLERNEGVVSDAAVIRIWREIISVFTALQGEYTVAVCLPPEQPGYWDLARDHFGNQAPMQALETPGQVIRTVAEQPMTSGVVPLPEEGEARPWWPLLLGMDGATPRIVAKLPFCRMPNARGRALQALVVARVQPEPSGADRSLIVLESGEEISRAGLNTALGKADLPKFTGVYRHEGGANLALIELDGFVAPDDARLATLAAAAGKDARATAIGAYAVTMEEATK